MNLSICVIVVSKEKKKYIYIYKLIKKKICFVNILFPGGLEQTGKKQRPWTPQSSFKKRFSTKFVKLFVKFGSLNVQIRNNLKNIICIACKWSKICKFYVKSMVISCNTCQKEEKECTWVKYLIFTVLSRFQICHN